MKLFKSQHNTDALPRDRDNDVVARL